MRVKLAEGVVGVIRLYRSIAVYFEVGEGVDGDKDDAAPGVDAVLLEEADAQVVEDRGLVKVGERGQVICADENVRVS